MGNSRRSEEEKIGNIKIVFIKSYGGCIKRKTNYEKVSEALYVWFIQLRDKGVPISGPILQQKALHFRNEFNEGNLDFTGSVGWLDRWKKSYNIRQLSVCGEKFSLHFEEMGAFKKICQEFIETESITGDQISNYDESGLNYKMLSQLEPCTQN
ncbi:hypothetical protein PR048_002746 [Dryococelus australis]|uniref:HTH CENPB-type domain-containing protein n=1 Tax=Dryococelus australis TaxID=614101 RepID=A0ABQ9IMJ0_9NEOP|nr:hypothetical protein PR048_002746 [Dryococelus australis]